MSELKCPFCNKPLQPTLRQSDEYWCENYDCPRTNIEWVGSQKLWQELIRTRKALEIAKKWLMKIGYLNMSDHGLGSEKMMTDWCKTVALHGLKEIETALEQKD
jgi:hypothetical protein